MHFDARVCGFCRPLTLLCWHDVSDIFSYYRLFVDDLIDTLGLKLYICVQLYVYNMYNIYIHVSYVHVCMYVCMYVRVLLVMYMYAYVCMYMYMYI